MEVKKRLYLSEQPLFLAARTPAGYSSIYVAILLSLISLHLVTDLCYFLNTKRTLARPTRATTCMPASHLAYSVKATKGPFFCRSSWRVRDKGVIHRLRPNQRQGLQHYILLPSGQEQPKMMPLYHGPKKKV
jgi:hypothetical protein